MAQSRTTRESKRYLEVGIWPDCFYPVVLRPEEYQAPLYALGLPGHGKSVLLGNLALQLNELGEGVLVLDVKDGQLAKDIVSRSDPAKTILVAPGLCNFDGRLHHWGLNVIELKNRQRHTLEVVIDNLMSMFERMNRADFSIMTQLRSHLDMAVRLSLYEPEPTLLTVHRILTDEVYRKSIYRRDGMNPTVKLHWQRFDNPKEQPAYAKSSQLLSTLTRLEEIITPSSLYYMVGQGQSTIRIADWLNEGKLVVVDCASGMSGRNAELLGNLVLALAMHATFLRQNDEQPAWRLVCDEFDKLAGNNFAELLTKGRSYNVFPIMANQNMEQLKVDRDKAQGLYNAATGVPVVFRLAMTDEDRKSLKYLVGEDEVDSINTLAKYQARLFVRSGVPGLLDGSRNASILLSNWRTEAVPQWYTDAIAAQQPFTTAEYRLRERMESSDQNHQGNRSAGESVGDTRSDQSTRKNHSPSARPAFVPGASLFTEGNNPNS